MVEANNPVKKGRGGRRLAHPNFSTGVRPSPGAATSVSSGISELSAVLGGSNVAAPGDGRTPSACWQAQALIFIAEPRTAPGPFFRQHHELCLRGVVLDISLRAHLMLAVAQVRIPVPFLPELAFAPKNLVRRLGRVTFPSID